MDNSETQEIFNSIKDKLRHWTSSVFRVTCKSVWM